MMTRMVNLLGALGAALSFVLFLPQAALVWRSRCDHARLRGVSIGTQVLILCNATVWGIYAIITGAFWVGAPGLVNASLALASIYFVARARRSSELAAQVQECRCGLGGLPNGVGTPALEPV